MAKPKKKGKKETRKVSEQVSLSSFIEKKKPKKEIIEEEQPQMVTKEQIEMEILGIKEQPKTVAKKELNVIESGEKVSKKETLGEIPKNLYYKPKSTNFGLLEKNTQFKKKERESGEAAYVRFLIENGKITTNLENGVLLDVDYDGGQNKAYCKFYDLESKEIKIWIDTTGHTPYCLSKRSKTELDNDIDLTNFDGFVRNETVKRYDLLLDKEIEMTKVYGKTPTSIGARGKAIRDILKKENAWEADIRYHQNYIYDEGLIPGLIYEIKNNEIIKKDFSGSTKETIERAKELSDIFKDESKALKDFANRYLEIFNTPIIDLKRVAIDIEINMNPDEKRIPDPSKSKNKIISISFVGIDGLKKVYVLEREGFSMGEKIQDTPNDLEIVFFKDEKDLLIETFRIMWKYPVVITFNGDNFDLNYLFHRAKKLKISEQLNPILVRAGFGPMRKAECNLKKGLHIDLYSFFSNRSIKGYAFGGAYERNSLDMITTALLGEGKFKHDEEIHEMTYNRLIYYNYKDSEITLELTRFNDSVVMNLITILLRISKMPLHDLIRHQISAWIKNIFYFEHREKNYLIPRRSEISELKKGGTSQSIIEGKGFQGAIVIDPVPGTHYNVVVLDFASLYPSIIKEYNLSYETVQCPHETCKENLIKGIPYHVCNKRTGIFSYVTGFFRDVRVKYFKPKSSDKTILQKQRNIYQVLQQALKVFINGCLPYNEEIIVKEHSGKIYKCPIGSIENKWEKLEVLSIENKKTKFGTPNFVPIKAFRKRITNELLKIRLSDGREVHCTSNHVIPKIKSNGDIEEVFAKELNVNDELMVLHKIPFPLKVMDYLFIPQILDWENRWIGIRRENYKQYSYRSSQKTTDPLIHLINSRFEYLKASKMYRTLWGKLNQEEQQLIKQEAIKKRVKIYVKIHNRLGRWYSSIFKLTIEFFSFLGWYTSEGSIDKNRLTIHQSKTFNPENWKEIIELLNLLGFPYSTSNNKMIRINSNVISELTVALCSKLAKNKTIPFELLNEERANSFLNAFFKGDGNIKKEKWRRFSTISPKLKNDLITILGAIGSFSSVNNPAPNDQCFRVIETEGRKYKRKNKGLVFFNGTTPVRIKSIENKKFNGEVFDLETGNGWFVTTNGIIVHNSYGVFGSPNFPLFCLPVAESTTGIGRYSIQSAVKKAESLGTQVLYGDTDSIFLKSPTKSQLNEISNWSKDELDLDLEEEKTYQFLALSKRKKNYIGVYAGTKTIDIKGMTAKKSNTPNFIKKTFDQLTEILRDITNNEEFDKSRQKIIDIIRKDQNAIGKKDGFTKDDYVISLELQRPLDKYIKTTPQHVKAARIMQNVTKKELQKGDIVSFVKTRDSEGVKPVELAKLEDIDGKAYRNLLKNAVEQLLDALGISYEEIRGIKKMDSFF